MQKPKSVIRRTAFSLLVISIFVFVFIGIMITRRTYNYLLNSLDRDVINHADLLVSHTDIENNTIHFDVADVDLSEFEGTNARAYYVLLNSAGGEVARSPSMGNHEISVDISTLKMDLNHFWSQSLDTERVRFLARKVVLPWDIPDEEMQEGQNRNAGNRPVTSAIFIVGVSDQDIMVHFDNSVRIVVLSLALGFLILLLTGHITIAMNLHHFKSFADEVDALSSRHLKRVNVPDIAELSSTAGTLNRLIDELNIAFTREKQFTANVAHELRTPLAEIRTHAEINLHWPDKLDNDIKSCFSDILASSLHMQRIVENLLILTRYDSSQLSMNRTEFRIDPLLQSAWNRLSDKVAERKLSLIRSGDIDCIVHSDESMLKIILDNLVSNAVEYCVQGDNIQLNLKTEQDFFVIAIENEVTNLEEEDLPRLFDRFWRKSGTRSTNDTHTGLGLALVKSLVDHLNMSITVEMHDAKSIRFVISGPVK